MDISQNLINIIKCLPEEQRKVIIQEFIEEPLMKLTNAYIALKQQKERKVEESNIEQFKKTLTENGYLVFDSVEDDDYKQIVSFLQDKGYLVCSDQLKGTLDCSQYELLENLGEDRVVKWIRELDYFVFQNRSECIEEIGEDEIINNIDNDNMISYLEDEGYSIYTSPEEAIDDINNEDLIYSLENQGYIVITDEIGDMDKQSIIQYLEDDQNMLIYNSFDQAQEDLENNGYMVINCNTDEAMTTDMGKLFREEDEMKFNVIRYMTQEMGWLVYNPNTECFVDVIYPDIASRFGDEYMIEYLASQKYKVVYDGELDKDIREIIKIGKYLKCYFKIVD